MLPEVFHVPYPMAYHGVSVEDSLDAIERLFRTDVDPARVAAIIIEPVLGEGGFYAAPAELLRKLRALCDQHGIVFIVDEIQAGFGRTGKMFAIEHSGVEPDLLTLAKSVAGGVPLSAVVGKAEIMDAPGPGGLGGTFAGSPLACAAGLAVLDVIRDERLLERASQTGNFLVSRLRGLQARFPAIGDVRGLGAMVAIELVKHRRADSPDGDLARAVVQAAARRGLVLLACGMNGNVLRFLTPLTISDSLLREGMNLFEQAFADALHGLGTEGAGAAGSPGSAGSGAGSPGPAGPAGPDGSAGKNAASA
jgi:4-aminobutyrate aminotransferase/(S)-3-amino-2-methylpropionate transaminase